MGNTDPWVAAATRLTTPDQTTPLAAPTQDDPWMAAAARVQPQAQGPMQSDPWEQSAARIQSTQPPIQSPGIAGQAWDWVNKPLADLTREGAGPIETGVEKVASSFTSPLSFGMMASTFGESAVAQLLGKTGMAAVDAVAAAKTLKLAADVGLLGKYAIDVDRNTLPQFDLNWHDYRNATNDRDRQKALDRMKEFGTETILNALTAGLAYRGVGQDVEELRAMTPKGKALANVQYGDGAYGLSQDAGVGRVQAAQVDEEGGDSGLSEREWSAITRNREARGDMQVLERQAKTAEANPLTKHTAQEFRDAMHLSDRQIEERDGLINILKGDFQHLKYLNMLPEDAEKDNFAPHLWDYENRDENGKPITTNTGYDDAGMLKRRTFQDIAEGEQKGAKPTTTNFSKLVADYHERVANVIAKRNLAEKLASSYMNDGSPMGAPGKLLPGYTTARDAPVTPEEVAKAKAAGTFDALLQSGRIYEVPPKPPEMEGEPGLVVAKKRLEGPTRELGEDEEEKSYMWKQRDFEHSGLYVWPPTSQVAGDVTPASEIIPFGTGPFPEQAIMKPGEGGIPTDQAPRVPMVRIPVMVHPEIMPHLGAMLESQVPENPFLRGVLKASSEAKSDLLSLSPFHWANITGRTLDAGMNPFGEGHNLARQVSAVLQRAAGRKPTFFAPKPIDYFNLTDEQNAGFRDGVAIGPTRPGRNSYAEEGNVSQGNSLIDKIPLVGRFNEAIERQLFGPQGWIASLKLDLYSKLKQQHLSRDPSLTDVQAGRIAARQVNNKFGGLNYTVMGRGATTQHALRAMFLAPDFLESTGRTVLDMVGPHGTPLFKSFVAFNVAQWALARALNYAVSGDTHPDAGMAVLSKNGEKQYTIRTTLGDFMHFVEKPKDFMMNRLNPLLVRAPSEIATGEDPTGHKVTDTQALFDALRQVVPIPIQGVIPNQQIVQPSETDQLLQSVGLQSRKNFTPAEDLAHQIESKGGEEGAPLEGDELKRAQMRYKLEDQLRTAINAKDQKGRADAMQAIEKASIGTNPAISHQDRQQIIQQAHKYPLPLQSTVAHLGVADALQVWDKSSILERRALRPIIQNKIENWESKTHTARERADMRQRIRAFRYSLGG